MALVPPLLLTQLQSAFANAMREFIRVSKEGGVLDTQELAIQAASQKFGTEASAAIDIYIRTATITIPPAGVIVAANPLGVFTNATPTLPAIIV